LLKTAFWGGKNGSVWHFNKTTPPKSHPSKGFCIFLIANSGLFDGTPQSFFMAHEKGSFGHEKREH